MVDPDSNSFDNYLNGGAVINVRTICGEAGELQVIIGLDQWSVLSPYLFALIINKLIAHIQNEVLLCMLFVDNIMLVDKLRNGVNKKL